MIQFQESTGVYHIRTPKAGLLCDLLHSLNFSSKQILYWLDWGCVYVEGQRQIEDCELKSGHIIRLHTRPKMYAFESGDLENRVVAQDDEFVVFDKPSGMPTHETLDNRVQNARHLLGCHLGVPLFTTHRLDIPTQGLLVFAKSRDAQALINKAFAKRLVQKIYHAHSLTAVKAGRYVHYLNPADDVPRRISVTPQAGWWECRLTVLDQQPHPDSGFIHRVRLETGKTHQIRAQFAALDAPLVGDAIYGRESQNKKKDLEPLGLECHSLTFPFRSRSISIERPQALALYKGHWNF